MRVIDSSWCLADSFVDGPSGHASGAGWYVLLADDDHDFRHLAAESLRGAGFRVCEADDGQQLIARYESLCATTELPIVVVTDIDMPGRDGLEAIRCLKGRWHDLPVVVMTGAASADMQARAFAAGADLVILKPISRDAFRKGVSSVLPSP